MKAVPKAGEYYHFFDDGKTSSSRHYICKCEELITKEQSKSILFDYKDNNLSLYDIWRIEIDNHRQEKNFTVITKGAKTEPGEPWLYAEDTDYFVKLSCPTYDDDYLYAVRTVDGGWFTLDIKFWQSGRLDVDDSIYNSIIKEYKKNKWDITYYTKTTYDKHS